MHISYKHFWMTALLFSCISAIMTAFQSTRITPFVDYAYQVEAAYRIFLGEMPYRDFFLVLPPGTYVVMALLMKLTNGYVHAVAVLYTMGIAFTSLSLVAWILARIGIPLSLCLFLLFPLIFTGQALYAWPSYDINTALIILIALSWLMYLQKKKNVHLLYYLAGGILISFPTYFKQTMGLVFSGSIALIWILLFLRFRKKEQIKQGIALVCGIGLSYGFFVLLLNIFGAWNQFIFQTFVFPSQIRRPLTVIMGVYKQYNEYLILQKEALPWLLIATAIFAGLLLLELKKVHRIKGSWLIFSLAISAFLCMWWGRLVIFEPLMFHRTVVVLWSTTYLMAGCVMLVRLFGSTSPEKLFLALLPIPLAATAHAAYLSGNMVYNSYGIWPFLVLMLGGVLLEGRRVLPRLIWMYPVGVLSCILAVFLFRYIESNQFFNAGSLNLDGTVEHATISPLRGMGAAGPWIPNMERMIRYSEQNIPRDDRVAFLPGEDPFFAVTGRINPLPFNQLNYTTFTPVSSQIVSIIVAQKVDWLIVKTDTQLIRSCCDLFDVSSPNTGVTGYFYEITKLPGYTIYRRI